MKKIYLLFLTITILAFHSCSSSENENLSENFLKKLDKTVWKFDNGTYIRYYVFNNIEKRPVTTLSTFNSSNSGCYSYGDEFGQLNSATYGNELTLTVQENEIIIFADYGGDTDKRTFIILGDNILIKGIENVSGNISESERTLIKTNLFESDLTPICP